MGQRKVSKHLLERQRETKEKLEWTEVQTLEIIVQDLELTLKCLVLNIVQRDRECMRIDVRILVCEAVAMGYTIGIWKFSKSIGSYFSSCFDLLFALDCHTGPLIDLISY